jgi:hypothetical protein
MNIAFLNIMGWTKKISISIIYVDSYLMLMGYIAIVQDAMDQKERKQYAFICLLTISSLKNRKSLKLKGII